MAENINAFVNRFAADYSLLMDGDNIILTDSPDSHYAAIINKSDNNVAYFGECVGKQPTGYGERHAGDAVAIGEFINGKLHGYGSLTVVSINCTIRGRFERGLPTGTVRYTAMKQNTRDLITVDGIMTKNPGDASEIMPLVEEGLNC